MIANWEEPTQQLASPLIEVAEQFATAAPTMLRGCMLLERTDTKFLVPRDKLLSLLAAVRDDYSVLRAGARCFASYDTLYFETPDLRCFHDHRRGRRTRYKVRIRHYPDRRLSFLEVKSKQRANTTNKFRLDWPYGNSVLGPEGRAFVEAHTDLPSHLLWPKVWISFSRLTLLGPEDAERITIDVDLELGRTPRQRQPVRGVAFVEVKQRSYHVDTPIMRALRAHKLRAGSASKYCLAIAHTHPRVRLNRLRPYLREIERLQR